MFALCVVFLPVFTAAQETRPLLEQDRRYVADVELQTRDQLIALLERAEQLLLAGTPLPEEGPQVTFVLHGPVLESLLRDNYLDNKRLVDLAASLSALAIIEVKACNTWMAREGLDAADLQPFVEPVPYGAGLVDRLISEQDYRYF